MTAKDQEMEELVAALEERDAGVADLMALYKRVEDIYIQASASLSDSNAVYTSDSTNIVRSNAYLGRDSS